jgi:hypothetical protein
MTLPERKRVKVVDFVRGIIRVIDDADQVIRIKTLNSHGGVGEPGTQVVIERLQPDAEWWVYGQHESARIPMLDDERTNRMLELLLTSYRATPRVEENEQWLGKAEEIFDEYKIPYGYFHA